MPRRNYKTKPSKHTPYQLSSGGCEGKGSYESKQAADWVAQDQMKYSLNVEIHSYHCTNCGKWHLTSSKN